MMHKHSAIPQSNTQQQIEVGLARHWGNTLPLSFQSNGEPKYLLGPHYYVFGGALLLSSIVFVWMGVSLVVNSRQKTLQIAIACSLSVMFYIYQYVRIGFSLPGVGSSPAVPDQQTITNDRFCLPCRAIRERGTIHCLYCDLCILQHDHHCPWIGKCVGRDNAHQFKTFLTSIFIMLCVFAAAVYFA